MSESPAKTRRPKAAANSTAKPEATPEPVVDAAGFEDAMRELETLVERLEQGDLGLEESLSVFERGIGLTRACQQALDRAEQKVQVLTMDSAPEPVASPSPDQTNPPFKHHRE